MYLYTWRGRRGRRMVDSHVTGFAGLRVCGFAGLRVCGFAGLRVCGFAGLRVCGFAGLRVCGFAGLRVCGFAGLLVCGFGTELVTPAIKTPASRRSSKPTVPCHYLCTNDLLTQGLIAPSGKLL